MLKQKIEQLRAKGLSYNEIAKKLKCTKSVVSYHLSDVQKQKNIARQRKNRNKQHPYIRKLENFSKQHQNTNIIIGLTKNRRLIQKKIESFSNMNNDKKYSKPSFTVKDIISKFGEKPKCYLTGEEIDIYLPRSYHFDHIIPRSRGGSNNIDNLGICTSEANKAKNNMTPDELIQLCKKILINNGYNINKARS